ncbi:type-2 ice-structuring protein-like [Eleginops maclovinus]
MKTLAVFALVCAMMAVVRAAAISEAAAEEHVAVKSHVVKRSVYCGRGWTSINGRCFYYNPRPLSWSRAERNCHSLRGNLASVHNIMEYHAIQKMILATTHQMKQAWIGGSDAHEVTVWYWTDGTPFSYTDWCDGEPNSRGVQRCLQMNHSEDKCWDNLQCSVKLPSICVKRN